MSANVCRNGYLFGSSTTKLSRESKVLKHGELQKGAETENKMIRLHLPFDCKLILRPSSETRWLMLTHRGHAPKLSKAINIDELVETDPKQSQMVVVNIIPYRLHSSKHPVDYLRPIYTDFIMTYSRLPYLSLAPRPTCFQRRSRRLHRLQSAGEG
jgi:hypothetical protein